MTNSAQSRARSGAIYPPVLEFRRASHSRKRGWENTALTKLQEFLRHAETCKRLAEDGDVAAHRGALESMGYAWLQLAAEEERLAALVREIEKSLFTPGD